jgi:hypothetical protein
MRFMNQENDEIEIQIEREDNLEVGEIVRSSEGEMYEVLEVGANLIRVELVQVDEDWGQ